MSDPQHKCNGCKYWTPLGPGTVSFGTCDWFAHHSLPSVPIWSRVKITHGSISPNNVGCKVWEVKL